MQLILLLLGLYKQVCTQVVEMQRPEVIICVFFFPTAPSSPPQSVSGVAQSPTVLSFTWSPPPPVDINGIILYYEVDLREVETGQRWTFFALGDDLRLGSLHAYYTYQCEIAAHTVRRGPFSDPFQLKTLETCKTLQCVL